MSHDNQKLTITKDLGYILGVIYGDGYLSENSIGLNVKDKDFALTFKTSLEKFFRKNAKLHSYNGLWCVLLHSRSAVKFLKKFDYHIIVNCSQDIKCAFLKGFYDSEGSAYYHEKTGVRNRKIELCNTNLELLTFCKNLLQVCGIKTLKIGERIRKEREIKGRKLKPTIFFRFHLAENIENLKLFKNLIGFSIMRKQKNLEKMIDSYIHPDRNKWLEFKEKVLHDSKVKRYSELRQEFYFIPKSVIDYWIYPKNSRK
jgi:intein-encoded DNA endonuclease-like protein